MCISVSCWQSWQCWTLVTSTLVAVQGLDQDQSSPVESKDNDNVVSYKAAAAFSQISHQKSCHTVKLSEQCSCQTRKVKFNSLTFIHNFWLNFSLIWKTVNASAQKKLLDVKSKNFYLVANMVQKMIKLKFNGIWQVSDWQRFRETQDLDLV